MITRTDPMIFIKNQIPGIPNGFNEKAKPWTKKEQSDAIEREEIIKDMNSRMGLGPVHP